MTEIVLADFFSGCGGTTGGFVKAGIKPVLAIDWDPDAVATFRRNFPDTKVIERDICEVDVKDVESDLWKSSQHTVRLFAGCAPCQPFAGHQHKPAESDSRSFLLLEFLRFVKAFKPELVFVENVPGIQRLSASDSPNF